MPDDKETMVIREQEFQRGQLTQTIYQMGKDVSDLKKSLGELSVKIDSSFDSFNERLIKVEGFIGVRAGIEKYILAPLVVTVLAGALAFIWALATGRMAIIFP